MSMSAFGGKADMPHCKKVYGYNAQAMVFRR